MSNNDDILIRLRLNDESVRSGFAALRREAHNLEGALEGIGKGVPGVQKQVSEISTSVLAGTELLERRFERVSSELKRIKDLRASIINLPEGSTSKEKAEQASKVAALEKREHGLTASLAAIGGVVGKMADRLNVAARGLATAESPAAIGQSRRIAGFRGLGPDQALRAVELALKDFKSSARGPGSGPSQGRLDKLFEADARSKSRAQAESMKAREAELAGIQKVNDLAKKSFEDKARLEQAAINKGAAEENKASRARIKLDEKIAASQERYLAEKAAEDRKLMRSGASGGRAIAMPDINDIRRQLRADEAGQNKLLSGDRRDAAAEKKRHDALVADNERAQIRASALQIAIDRAKAKSEDKALDSEIGYSFSQFGKVKSAKIAAERSRLTPQVAAAEMEKEQEAIRAAMSSQAKSEKEHATRLSQLNSRIEKGKADLAAWQDRLKEQQARLDEAYKPYREVSAQAKAASTKNAPMIAAVESDKYAAIHRVNIGIKEKADAALAAQDEAFRAKLRMSRMSDLQRERAAYQGKIDSGPEIRGQQTGPFADKLRADHADKYKQRLADVDKRILDEMKRIPELVRAEAVARTKAFDATSDHAKAVAKGAKDIQRIEADAAAQVKRLKDEQVKAGMAFDQKLDKLNPTYEIGRLASIKGKIEKISKELEASERSVHEAQTSWAGISEANKRALEAAKANAAKGASARAAVMSPANINRAEKILDDKALAPKKESDKALADNLTDAAIQRQIRLAKARISLYDQELVDLQRKKFKSQQSIPIGLSDSQMAKVQLSQLKDLEASLRAQHGTPAQARAALAPKAPGGMPPGWTPPQGPPQLAPIQGTKGVMDLAGLHAAVLASSKAGQAVRTVASGVESLSSKIGEAGGKLVNFVDKTAFGLWKVQGSMRLVTGAWQQFMDILSKGEAVMRVEHAFDTMTKGAGTSMEGLREATKGMVTDEALQRLANFGVQSKMTGEELDVIAKRATGAALITGKSTEEMSRRFIEGIAKQEREIMDEATVIMSNASNIWNKEAKRLGKRAQDLTQQEKQRAYMKDFIQQSAHLDRIASNFPDKLAKIGRAQTMMTNTWNVLWAKVSTVFAESGALDQMGTFVEKVTGKLGEISGSNEAIVWANRFGDMMTEMARTALAAGAGLSPLLEIIPLLTNSLSLMQGPLGAAINLWSRFQTIKLSALGAGIGMVGGVAGVLSGDDEMARKGTDTFLDAGYSIAKAAGIARSEDERAEGEIKYTQKARDAMAAQEKAEREGKPAFQVAAKDAREYAKALSYLYSEEKKLHDLKQENIGKPKLAADGTNYQVALDAAKRGPQGLMDPSSLVEVAGGAAGLQVNRFNEIAKSYAEQSRAGDWSKVIDERRVEQQELRANILRSFAVQEDLKAEMMKLYDGGHFVEGNEARFQELKAQYDIFTGSIAKNTVQVGELNKEIAGLTGLQSDYVDKANDAKAQADAAASATLGMMDSVRKYGEAEAASSALVQDLYSRTMVTVPGRLNDKLSIKDWIGSRSTLHAGPVAEYGPEQRLKGPKISQEEIVALSDELTLDPARKKDAKGTDQYKQEAVKTNLEAFRRMEVELLDSQYKLLQQKEAIAKNFEQQSMDITIAYLNAQAAQLSSEGKSAEADQIWAIARDKSYKSASEILAKLPEGMAQGASDAIAEAKDVGDKAIAANEQKIAAELEQARAMIKELEKRLATKGGRKKEKKYIHSELLDLAESFGSEAIGSGSSQIHNMQFGDRRKLEGDPEKYAGGKYRAQTESLARGYMNRLSTETAEAFERGIKIEVTDEVKEKIKAIVDENQRAQIELMTQAMASGSREAFDEANQRIAALQASLDKTNLIQYLDDQSIVQAATQARNEQIQSETEAWNKYKEMNDRAKEAMKEATDADFEYRSMQATMAEETRQHAMAMTYGGFNYGTKYATQAEVDPNDIPDWMREATRDPMIAIKREDFERKKAAIIEERDRKLKELLDLQNASGIAGATNMAGYWQQEQAIQDTANSKLSTVGAELAQADLAQTRAASEMYYREVLAPWQNMGDDMLAMFGEGVAFGLHDMWVAAANDAEDYTESMLAMFERMTGGIGSMLQETASATIAAYTGSPLLGKVTGGLIKGTWDAVMNLFKKKEKRKEEQSKRAERELRRKESKKTDQFTVVVVNNGLSVNRDTARQVGSAINAYVAGGGKLKTSR